VKSDRKKEPTIQTGLRIPQNRYDELLELSNKAGISLNAFILAMVDLGLSVRAGHQANE